MLIQFGTCRTRNCSALPAEPRGIAQEKAALTCGCRPPAAAELPPSGICRNWKLHQRLRQRLRQTLWGMTT
ncbi:hypothetical protein EVAR_81466_1 [Eumeta japonica]|uniref:Uncharacterized protein n=1 Tax=Eumeta variegata TaxID=151549 RepID=A0A4C1W1U4_EUMVA|nr:hypothetical protein EVAR_81466_1 [Eumeta japonica]